METIFQDADIEAALARCTADLAGDILPDSSKPGPWHTVYGGAHLFRPDVRDKLSKLAAHSFSSLFPDAYSFTTATGGSEDIYNRVTQRLAGSCIEDYRVDFEDGYGFRSDDQEDADAIAVGTKAAEAHKAGLLPPGFGIRVRAMVPESAKRAARTLERMLGTMLDATAGRLPNGFVIALPKVSHASQVSAFVQLLRRFEERALLPAGVLRMELLIETPRSLFDRQGAVAIPRLVSAAEGRCVALHLGAFDLTAACEVAAPAQRLDHPLCDFARSILRLATATTPVIPVDGVTARLPIGDDALGAWEEHYRNVHRALEMGIGRGWDLHPGQIGARAAANFTYFRAALAPMVHRFASLLTNGAAATRSGVVFDDVASGEGLFLFFRRALAQGATTAAELQQLGLTADVAAARSFRALLHVA